MPKETILSSHERRDFMGAETALSEIRHRVANMKSMRGREQRSELRRQIRNWYKSFWASVDKIVDTHSDPFTPRLPNSGMPADQFAKQFPPLKGGGR